jgi:hypothetical protein
MIKDWFCLLTWPYEEAVMPIHKTDEQLDEIAEVTVLIAELKKLNVSK